MSFDPKKLQKELPPGTQLEVIMFPQYVRPNGFLDSSAECHALFWYYVNARRTYDEYYEKMEVVLEGEKDPTTNFAQLFQSIAFLYNVNPGSMAKCWDMVDMQATSLGMPLLPDENGYRHREIIVVN